MTIDLAEIQQLIRIVTQRTGRPVFDEDLTQEATVRALEAFRRTVEVKHPRAFLRKIVCDTVYDHWRRRRSWEDLDLVDEKLLSLQPQLEEDLDRHRRTALLHAALRSLDPPKRAIIQLFYEDDLTVAQIAALQNSSISAVKMQLMRARRHLARIVAPHVAKKSRL